MTFKHKLSSRLALMRDAFSVLASVVAFWSCEVPLATPNAPTQQVVQVIVAPESISLDPTQHLKFAAYGRTTSGDSATVAVTWTATGGTIASDGMFAADTAAGDFTVTGTSATLSLSASSRVRIRPRRVASVSVTPGSASGAVGQPIQLVATPRDANGNALAGRVVTWGSSNTAVATVNGNGMVTGVAVGSVTITATSEGKDGTAAITVTQTPAAVASVSVTPASASVIAGQTVQLSATPRDASGNALTGRVVTWGSSNTAVATVNAGGVVTGVAAGSATITATSEGQSGAAAISVTAAPAPVASVSVSPASTSVTTGQTVQLTATTRDASGNALTGRVVTWASSNTAVATVNASGVVTGVAAGSATITATSEGKSGTSGLTVTPVPVASVAVSPASASVTAGQTVQLTAIPRDANGNVLTGRVITWGSSNTASATVNGSGLVAGVAAGAATIMATSEGKSGTAAVTVTAVSGGGTVLFEEHFEDNAFASRGWYDNTSPVTTTAEHAPGSTRALEMHFTQGARTPVSGGAVRHLFSPTRTVYVSYWVKYSTNWVGSAHPYHPHEFLIMSDMDGAWDGPSNGWLVAYVEHNYQNGGIPRLALQDSKAINTSFGTPPLNLTGVTENRSTCGCNGIVEPNVVTSCFSFPPWYNDKELIASQVAFKPNPGPGYKSDWNHVEAYFQLNSVVGGIGIADGVAQYWFNGALVIDRHDILFRTGARPTIKFDQFLIGVYIGDGSPVDQYMWVDDLTVATARP